MKPLRALSLLLISLVFFTNLANAKAGKQRPPAKMNVEFVQLITINVFTDSHKVNIKS